MIKKMFSLSIIMCANMLHAYPPTENEQDFLQFSQQHIASGSDINMKFDTPYVKEMTLISIAAKCEFVSAIRYLLESKPRIDLVDERGRTPIHYASINTSPEIMRLLLNTLALYEPEEQKVIINTKDNQGKTPLHEVFELDVDDDAVTIASLLIQSGADVNTTNNRGRTPLHRLLTALVEVDGCKQKIIQLLLDAGARVDIQDEKGQTSVHKAAKKADLDEFILILKKAVEARCIDNQDDLGDTALHKACSLHACQTVIHLLMNDADPTRANISGKTPLMLLFENFLSDDFLIDDNIEKLVWLFLKHPRCNLDISDVNGNTLLHYVASWDRPFYKKKELLDVFKKKVDVKNTSHLTPLFYLMKRGDVSGVLYLLALGANPAICDVDGLTPFLHLLNAELDYSNKLQISSLLYWFSAPLDRLLLKKNSSGSLYLDQLPNDYIEEMYGIDYFFIEKVKREEAFECWRAQSLLLLDSDNNNQKKKSIVKLLRNREMHGSFTNKV